MSFWSVFESFGRSGPGRRPSLFFGVGVRSCFGFAALVSCPGWSDRWCPRCVTVTISVPVVASRHRRARGCPYRCFVGFPVVQDSVVSVVAGGSVAVFVLVVSVVIHIQSFSCPGLVPVGVPVQR